MKIFGFNLWKSDPNALRSKYFVSEKLGAVCFDKGAPCHNYYLPEIRTYLFDGHRNFALAHGIETCCRTIPEKGNVVVVVDYHMDWMPPIPHLNVRLPLSLGKRHLKKIAWLTEIGMINEVDFTRAFLNNGNLAGQIDILPPENCSAGENHVFFPDLEITCELAKAKEILSSKRLEGRVVTSFDMDGFYIPYIQGKIDLSAMHERIDQAASFQHELRGMGIGPAYYTVATTSFNFNKNSDHLNGRIAGEVEQATRQLLEKIRVLS